MRHHLRFISVSRKVCKHFSHFIIKQVPAKIAQDKGDLRLGAAAARVTPLPATPRPALLSGSSPQDDKLATFAL